MDIRDYTLKEISCRQELESKMKKAGRCHPDTIAALNGLADVMRYSGRFAEALAYKLEYYLNIPLSETVSYPEVGVEMNQLSIAFRLQGDFPTSELLLRRALEIERRAYPPDHPKLPHRMNNLTATLLLQGKFDEAAKWSREAWELKTGRHDMTSERILFIRILYCFLTGRQAGQPIGQLKTLLKVPEQKIRGNVDPRWDFSNSLEFYRPKISEEQFHLLMALSEAHNNRNPDEAIGSRFPLWSNQSEVSLDAPWGFENVAANHAGTNQNG